MAVARVAIEKDQLLYPLRLTPSLLAQVALAGQVATLMALLDLYLALLVLRRLAVAALAPPMLVAGGKTVVLADQAVAVALITSALGLAVPETPQQHLRPKGIMVPEASRTLDQVVAVAVPDQQALALQVDLERHHRLLGLR